MTSQGDSKTSHTRLADRLAAARHGRFIGRESELEQFRTALLADQSPFAILHIYGPGGVGKTTLLREYHRIAQSMQRTAVFLDSRNLEVSPAGFQHALYLLRYFAAINSYFNWSILGQAYMEPATTADHPFILEKTKQYEGKESAEIVRYWLQKQPQSFTMFRTAQENQLGFIHVLMLSEITEADARADPALAVFQSYMQERIWPYGRQHFIMQKFQRLPDSVNNRRLILHHKNPLALAIPNQRLFFCRSANLIF